MIKIIVNLLVSIVFLTECDLWLSIFTEGGMGVMLGGIWCYKQFLVSILWGSTLKFSLIEEMNDHFEQFIQWLQVYRIGYRPRIITDEHTSKG